MSLFRTVAGWFLSSPVSPAVTALPPTVYTLSEHRSADGRLIRFTKAQDEVARIFRNDAGQYHVGLDPTGPASLPGNPHAVQVESEQAGRALINHALPPHLRVRPG